MLEKECMSMHLKQRYITLEVALDISDIIDISKDDKENFMKNCADLKFKIVDGQHRFTAMMKIWEAIKDPAIILVKCHLVQGDDEIQELVEDLNKNLALTNTDYEDIIKKKDFRKLLMEDIFENITPGKRCVKQVIDSPILSEPDFVKCLREHGNKQIISVIKTISEEYKSEYETLVCTKKISPTIDQCIKISKMYQLIEGDNPVWLKRIPELLEVDEPLLKRKRT